MNVAYIVSAYQHPKQLIRLVLRLNTKNAVFFIHIDKKTQNKVYLEMIEGLKHFSNVYFLNRHKCYWGDFGHVEATLKGIRELTLRNISFDWVILLTGQDYPIKKNEQIEQFLEENSDTSFIEFFPLPNDIWAKANGGLDRIDYWHFIFLNKRVRFTERSINNCSHAKSIALPSWLFFLPIKRDFPSKFRPFGGGSYWCLRKEHIQYIYDFVETDSNQEFINFFKHVHIPDEIFFQTILLNSPYKHQIINSHLRCIDWTRGREMPAILNINDFQNIVDSHCLFARKFDVTKDAKILDTIDRHILDVK